MIASDLASVSRTNEFHPTWPPVEAELSIESDVRIPADWEGHRLPVGLSPIPHSDFTAVEVRSFQGDDAMATGMIGAILGIAFSVLLALTIGVTLWTMNTAG
jgi:hypothetical protein